MNTANCPQVLSWYGPFHYDNVDGLRLGGSDLRWATDQDLGKLKKDEPSGLYLFCVDHHVHGPGSLAYIGQAKDLGHRLTDHANWLRYEWSVEVYAAAVPAKLLDSIEKLLIYAHSPYYNSRNIWNPPEGCQGLHVRNVGRFKHLLPDVCADHPWFAK